MKAVKYLGIFFLTVYCCTSCTEKIVSETLQIFIQNETDSIIHVTLYPIITEDVTRYPSSDMNRGYLRYTESDLSAPNDPRPFTNQALFNTRDFNIKPYTLATKIFDSIYISTANTIIKFTHENVRGYSENIFSENSTWDFEIQEGTTTDLFREIAYRDYIYKFLILKDKVIIE